MSALDCELTFNSKGPTAPLSATRLFEQAAAKGRCGGLWGRCALVAPLRRIRQFWRTFDFCSMSPSATGVEVFSSASPKASPYQWLTSYSPNRCSHQVRRKPAQENAFWPCDKDAGAQPCSHNPLEQREKPAAGSVGERVVGGKWRRERDWCRTFSIS